MSLSELTNFYIPICYIGHELFVVVYWLVIMDMDSLGYYRPLDLYKIQRSKSLSFLD